MAPVLSAAMRTADNPSDVGNSLGARHLLLERYKLSVGAVRHREEATIPCFCLFDCVTIKHAIENWHASFQACFHEAVGAGCRDVFEMCRLALDKYSEGDHSIDLAGLRKVESCIRQLKGPWHRNFNDILLWYAC